MQCPKCEDEESFATIESIQAIAPVEIKDGELVYGETSREGKVYWDTSTTNTDAEGHPLLHCMACDHEWFEQSITLPRIFQDAEPTGEQPPVVSLDDVLTVLKSL